MSGSDCSRPSADIPRTQRHDDECVDLHSSRLAATPFRDGGQRHPPQVGITYRMQRRSRRHRSWLLKLAAPEMKLVASFPSSLEDTRALAVVQDCSTATILKSAGIYAPGFSPDRCREQGDYHYLSQFATIPASYTPVVLISERYIQDFPIPNPVLEDPISL